MSHHRRLADYLQHVADAAGKILTYIEGMSKVDFYADERTQQAVIFNLVIIGEAAARMLETHADFLGRYPEVPWKGMKGMRNRIAHGYFEINIEIVWETARTAMPELLIQLPDIIAAAEVRP